MKHTEPLCENYEFRRLYTRGKSAVTPFLVAYAMKNRSGKSRLGLTTGKKVGNAVCRNRARRLMKEAYRLLEPKIKSGFDVVLVARVKTVHADEKKVEQALCSALFELGLLEEVNKR